MYIYTWVCLKMGGIYPEDMAQKKTENVVSQQQQLW